MSEKDVAVFFSAYAARTYVEKCASKLLEYQIIVLSLQS